MEKKEVVDFIVWLAQENPDCLYKYAEVDDLGECVFSDLYELYLKYKK